MGRVFEQTLCKSNSGLYFAPWAVFMAYDIISELDFSALFGFVEKGFDIDGLIKGCHNGCPAFGV
jgi:hypothetical protein